MKIVEAPRASAILYHLLVSQSDKRPWLMPANICPIVPITFLKAGVPFKFVDISATNLHLDLNQAEALVKTRKFGGLLYAHTYGEASTPNEFFSTIKNSAPDLLVIDDRCLCIPDLAFDPHNTADMQLYSTGYAKIVELNFGGYAFVTDAVTYQPVQLPFDLQHHEAIEKSYKHAISQQEKFIYKDSDWLETEKVMPTWSDYQQMIEVHLASSLEQSRLLNDIYSDMLPAEIQLPASFQIWRFNIRLKKKKTILDSIFSSGLFASSHYASLAGIMSGGNAPHAESLANEVINLFNDHHFTLFQAEQTCKIILENLS